MAEDVESNAAHEAPTLPALRVQRFPNSRLPIVPRKDDSKSNDPNRLTFTELVQLQRYDYMETGAPTRGRLTLKAITTRILIGGSDLPQVSYSLIVELTINQGVSKKIPYMSSDLPLAINLVFQQETPCRSCRNRLEQQILSDRDSCRRSSTQQNGDRISETTICG